MHVRVCMCNLSAASQSVLVEAGFCIRLVTIAERLPCIGLQQRLVKCVVAIVDHHPDTILRIHGSSLCKIRLVTQRPYIA